MQSFVRVIARVFFNQTANLLLNQIAEKFVTIRSDLFNFIFFKWFNSKYL